jgi:hypothetical protein
LFAIISRENGRRRRRRFLNNWFRWRGFMMFYNNWWRWRRWRFFYYQYLFNYMVLYGWVCDFKAE